MFIALFFLFYFIFKLYIIVLVLPNIIMNPPQVYMCSPSWTLLPPPSPYQPSGSSQCTSPKHPVSCIEPGLATQCLLSWSSQHVPSWAGGPACSKCIVPEYTVAGPSQGFSLLFPGWSSSDPTPAPVHQPLWSSQQPSEVPGLALEQEGVPLYPRPAMWVRRVLRKKN